MVIYAIVNLKTQRAYVGRSVRGERRWYEHQRQLRLGRHPSRQIQAAWDRDGEAWFSWITLETLPADATKLMAAERELWHLSQLIAPYNQSPFTLSGPVPGQFTHSAATKDKCRLVNLGRRASTETRQRISAARAGKSYPRKRGYTLSEETKQKMRQSHLGLKGTPESRAKQSAALKGRVFTQEWKDKIRAAKAGKPWSSKRREAFAMTLAS